MEDKEKDLVACDDNGDSANDKDAVVETSKKSASGKKLDKKKLVHLFSTVGLSAFFCAFYYCSMVLSQRNEKLFYFFPAVMFTYMGALTVLVLIYIIYNRGFSRKGVTAEMLPDEWSDEQKNEFIENGNFRLKRSKWLLVFIISFLVTFIAEAVALFLIPMVEGLIP